MADRRRPAGRGERQWSVDGSRATVSLARYFIAVFGTYRPARTQGLCTVLAVVLRTRYFAHAARPGASTYRTRSSRVPLPLGRGAPPTVVSPPLNRWRPSRYLALYRLRCSTDAIPTYVSLIETRSISRRGAGEAFLPNKLASATNGGEYGVPAAVGLTDPDGIMSRYFG